jgi:hypothetical protein
MSKKQKTKERTLIININSTQPVKFNFNKEKQILKIDGIKSLGNPILDKINIKTSYDRENGKPKILNDISLEKTNFSVNTNEAIFKNFKMIYGSDTNYKIIDNKKICVSCLTILSYKDKKPDYHPIKALVFYVPKEVDLNPEHVAWKYFIKYVCSSKILPKDTKIGFTIDSDYDKLSDFNNGNIKILNNFEKPDNVSLIYASSDNGKEFITNKLIAAADKCAKEIMIKLIDISEIPNYETPFIYTRKIEIE